MLAVGRKEKEKEKQRENKNGGEQKGKKKRDFKRVPSAVTPEADVYTLPLKME